MNNQSPNKPPRLGGPMPPRLTRSLLGWVVAIALALALLAFARMPGSKTITPDAFWTYARNGNLTGKIIVREKEILGELKPNTPGLTATEPSRFTVHYAFAAEDNFDKRLQEALKAGQARGGTIDYEYEFTGWWEGVLPSLMLMLVLFFLIWFFVFRRMGAAGGGAGFLGNFGRSRHKVTTKEQSSVTFDNVAGIDEAKEEVGEIIEFLKNPKKFHRLGGRIPRGVLLVGEPGCGKTLLAKAIAGEANVPFFSISGSDFVEMFVGVGASRVRDLFKQAKDNSPCIIFLDEIDAVGRRRGHGFVSGGHDEREQTLNAILVEMDGFDTSDQVIVIAATNRMDVLDPALTRPGRFDRQIIVPLPDVGGRLAILKIYAAKVRCADDVDLQRMARGTPMFSGADLEALVNEAAIAATMANKDYVEQADFEEARDKVRWGRARKSRVIDEKDKRVTAYHEAGHALTQLLTPDADPLHKVSIIPRANMGGATFSLPEKDRYLFSLKYCKAQLCVLFGGRVAEEIFCGDITSGAQSDIAQATMLARRMVLDWGMSPRLGAVNYANDPDQFNGMLPPGSKYSEKTAETVDAEVRLLIDEAGATTRKIIQENSHRLDEIAKALIKYETLSAEEVKQIVDGRALDKPTVDDLLLLEKNNTGGSPAEGTVKLRGRVLPDPG
ncbi:MAG: ATP-dependent zinc metalloprotease FtsH [Planctomycetaceae bacterium]|nr:ATP-dependent zinc metalloprotease FtsH [Planctomycetaceae bacterium]